MLADKAPEGEPTSLLEMASENNDYREQWK